MLLKSRFHWENYKYRLLLQIWHKSSLWSKNKPHRIINVYCPSDSSHRMCKSNHKSPIRKYNRFVWTVQNEKVDKHVWNISIISGSWCETINLDSLRSSQFLCLWSSNFPWSKEFVDHIVNSIFNKYFKLIWDLLNQCIWLLSYS